MQYRTKDLPEAIVILGDYGVDALKGYDKELGNNGKIEKWWIFDGEFDDQYLRDIARYTISYQYLKKLLKS